MNKHPIPRELALISFPQLNAGLFKLGLPQCATKAEALDALATVLATNVTIRISDIKNAPLTAVSRAASSSNSNADEIAKLAVEVCSLNSKADATFEDTLTLHTEVRDLTRKLQGEVAAIQGVDYGKVNQTIRSAVADLFETFKQADQFPSIAPTVAAAYPKTNREEAQHLFDGDLFYLDDEGNTVDFSTFEVEVWDDPAAPAVVPDYIFNPAALHQTLIALSTTIPHNTWLGGERGTGKTEFVTQVAARLKRRLFRINFDEGLERSEFIGSNTIENGNVVWKAGTLTQAIRHAGSIILLDEVGFARAQNISPLHAVTERTIHRALVIAETGERIPVSTGVVFFAADNSAGHGDESGNFAGVREQNSAFLDRFSYTLRFEYLCEDDEVDLITKRTGLRADATRSLVKFANVARAKARAGLLTQPPSLRQLFAWASAVQEGMPVGLAFNNSIVHKFPADCEAELRGAYAASIDSAQLKSYLVRK
jgi:cobaltochelatase CobS